MSYGRYIYIYYLHYCQYFLLKIIIKYNQQLSTCLAIRVQYQPKISRQKQVVYEWTSINPDHESSVLSVSFKICINYFYLYLFDSLALYLGKNVLKTAQEILSMPALLHRHSRRLVKKTQTQAFQFNGILCTKVKLLHRTGPLNRVVHHSLCVEGHSQSFVRLGGMKLPQNLFC